MFVHSQKFEYETLFINCLFKIVRNKILIHNNHFLLKLSPLKNTCDLDKKNAT